MTQPQPKSRMLEAGTLLFFCFLLLLPYFSGHWRLADDAYLFTTQFLSLQERILQQGMWPHWNPNSGLGQPWALSSGSELFFPPQLLWSFLIGWSEKSYLYYLMGLFFGGAWLAVRFAEKARLSRAGAIFFALTFVGNGYVLGLLSNPTLIAPYFLWPLLGIGLIELHEKSSHPGQAARKIGLALVLIETGGYPLTKILIYASTAVLYLSYVKTKAWKPLALASAAAVLATLPEWLSRIQALSLSERMGANIYSDASYGSPSNFLTLGSSVLPGLFLKRDQFQLGMVWLERSWWIGSISLALIIAGLWTGKLKLERLKAPALVALAGLLFSMGGHSFVREFAAMVVPLFEHLRFANNARLLTMTFAVFLAARSLTALEQRFPEGGNPENPKKILRLWGLFFLACTLAALSEAENGVRSAELYADASSGWKIGSLHALFYPLLAYSAFEFRWTLLRGWKWPLLVVLFQALSLADTSYAFRKLVATETREPLKTHEAFSIASPQPNERSMRAWFEGNDWIDWAGNKKVLNAYNPPYHRLLKEAQNDPIVKPLLSSLVSSSDKSMSFVIDRYFGNVIEVSGQGPASALITIHDFNDPSWTATVDGEAAPIQTAFRYFKTVQVPGGRPWKLRLEYSPPFFPMAWWLSAAGFGLIFGMPWLLPKRRR